MESDGVNCETIACRNFDLDLWKRSHNSDAVETRSLAREVLGGGAPVAIARLNDHEARENTHIKRID